MHQVERESNPSALIAVKNNRVKQYNKKSKMPAYYLEDGQEFQIELYNPRKYHVLAIIHLNGKPISNSGVILKPGQRIFLDRYIDKKNKLKFETYEVPDNEESREAIEYNGDLKIEFFHEEWDDNKGGNKDIEKSYPYPDPRDSHTLIEPCTWTDGPTNDDPTNVHNVNFYDNAGKPSYFSQNLGSEEDGDEGSMETGRVEEGDTSSQEFENVDMKFMERSMYVVEYKFYPVSQKPTTSEDITEVKRYCWSCGKNKKPKYNFCPHCGKSQD